MRAWHDDDLPHVLELLQAALGGGPAGVRPAEFFRWKHLENPFGRSFMLVAEADGRIIGLRAFMRWRFRADDRVVHAVRAVDTATHPDYQGRGVFSMLTRRAIEEMRGEVELIFNTPNEKSLPGYLKMGWQSVGRVPILVRPQHPVRLVRERSSFTDRPNRRPGDPRSTPKRRPMRSRARPRSLACSIGQPSRSEVQHRSERELPEVAVRVPSVARLSGHPRHRGSRSAWPRRLQGPSKGTPLGVYGRRGDRRSGRRGNRQPPVAWRTARSEGRPPHGIVPAWIDPFTFGAPTGFLPGAGGADHGREPST